MEDKINEKNALDIIPIIRKLLDGFQDDGFSERDVFNISQSLFITVIYNTIRPEGYDELFEMIKEKLRKEHPKQ